MRILILIGSLETGGAERQISQVAIGLARRNHQVTLCTLFPGGQFWEKVRADADVKLISLASARPRGKLAVAISLVLAPIRAFPLLKNIDVLYSALSITDLVAWMITRFRDRPALVWSVRAGSEPENWKLRIPFRLSRLVSRSIPLIIANSMCGKRFLEASGFRARRITCVWNGIDTNLFRYDPGGREEIRRDWHVGEPEILIGIVGRITREKGYEDFLQAARLLRDSRPNVRFVSIGGGSNAYQHSLREMAEDLGLGEVFRWAGERQDLSRIYSALDICCSASNTEGFPNVLAEALLCGARIVATDVGDSRIIVDDDNWVAPPRDPDALSIRLIAAVDDVVSHGRASATSQSVSRFSIERMIAETESELQSVIPASR